MPIIASFPGGSGSGGGGLSLAAAKNIKTLASHDTAYIKWTDPEDAVSDGATLATWSGTLLVRKEGSMPKSRRDGVVVLDSKTRNAYTDTYYADTGLTAETTYYYKLFPYTSDNVYTDSADCEFSVLVTAAVQGIEDWVTTNHYGTWKSGSSSIMIHYNDPPKEYEVDGIVLARWKQTRLVVTLADYDLQIGETVIKTEYLEDPDVFFGVTAPEERAYRVSAYPETEAGYVNTNPDQGIIMCAGAEFISTTPTQTGTLMYTGNEQSPTWDGYDDTKMTISGDASGTNAGNYTTVFIPKEGYQWLIWEDSYGNQAGHSSPVGITWTIGKGIWPLQLDKDSIELEGEGSTGTFTVTCPEGCVLHVSSNDESVVTATIDGNTVTVTCMTDEMDAVTDISVTAAANENYMTTSRKVVVMANVSATASLVPKDLTQYTNGLGDLSVEDVHLISKAISNNADITNETSAVYVDYEDIHRKVSVGDIIRIELSTALSDKYFVVLGFNHDPLVDENAYGTLTSTGQAGITLQLRNGTYTDNQPNLFPMHDSSEDIGGWQRSNMRLSKMPEVKNLLPAEWQTHLKAVYKYTCNETSDGAASVQTAEVCFLLSAMEIYNHDSLAEAMLDEGLDVYHEGYQYAYYAAGNSVKKTYMTNLGNTASCQWWTRTRLGEQLFCQVSSGVTIVNATGQLDSCGVSFAFCI